MYHRIKLNSSCKTEFIDITASIKQLLSASGVTDGLACIFVPHTTAAVTINENADPDVTADIDRFLTVNIDNQCKYHHSEGNSPAHIKASLLGSSEMVMIDGGELLLGTWQGIYFCEFDGPRQRTYFVKFIQEN
ncbi:MAG: secondary thiamine-phosphate synthase enzyme YjbQ [Dehalococcoidales bacterium]|jgi:secondary thiamine-phosphate synthase enzyme|nr:secondary thiamine-phosphate synthase enzyme YjbQ [Dehalococcoidales bacterium]MDD3264640.1 secondary thiamine-phosphate synthase enzyme YjbQ [Dehalococcoidales bacterium]MDD4322784.1 secondary thiamine-phosphate synthase enzyme YjbQ [Dehalococcoidales bacterium]MDD4794504.1 secondary thiamine-phosphate synthase enzyme YjbQ [Dehalococcoidales bacterium]MDD5122177.1 secondary thiamine-phosphate synthase enzyme YjbQ [Dehalococcoidales bacterium]